MKKCLFVTGTGTDVGKTYVTGLLIKKLREYNYAAGYYKAALSCAICDIKGNLQPEDALYVNDVAAIGADIEKMVSYIYKESVSPHLAAQINQSPIDIHKVTEDFLFATNTYDFLTVEGSGGIICPLRWDDSIHFGILDLIKQWELGVVLIADAGLGTINATVLTVAYLHQHHVPIRGIVLNRYQSDNIMHYDNKKMIEEMTGVNIVACVEANATDLDIPIKVLLDLYK